MNQAPIQLTDLGEEQRPEWLSRKISGAEKYTRASTKIAVALVALLVGCFGYLGYHDVPKTKFCLYWEEDFDGTELDESVWTYDISLGGHGTGSFDWTTKNKNNTYVKDGFLHIVPTLTTIPQEPGISIDLGDECTEKEQHAANCVTKNNASSRQIINPVQSGRINTKHSKSIQYGRVEVRARMPKGDYIWPAIWMLPVNNTYGDWPASGELDLLETRSNGPDYMVGGYPWGAQNIFSSVHWAPVNATPSQKYKGGALLNRPAYDDFHIYGLDWTEKGIHYWVDSPVYRLYGLTFKDPWETGNDGGSYSYYKGPTLLNPWLHAAKNAPFDQAFYLILNVAVGDTEGYFPELPGKPWQTNDPISYNAMRDFWRGKDKWYPTWPNDTRRGMTVDYVKMYKLC